MHRVKLLVLIFSMVCSGFVMAQTPRFYMQTDRSTVAEGETFILEAVLENIDSKTIELPDVSPFQIVQGPSTSTSISIVNGKRSGTVSYQYVLLATKKGKHIINAATSKVGSKTIKSNELTIEVSEASVSSKQNNIDAKGETFVRLELSDNTAYLGQQVVLNYVIYTRQNLESYNILNEPNLEGFYAQPLNDIRDQAQRRTLNGKEYYTQVIRRQILFPQKTGNYNIGPVNMTIDIPVENGRSSFFFRETRKENIATNAVKLSVKDLPKQPPLSFAGGVGDFDMKASITATTANVGEAITIKMQVSGNGDPKIIKAPLFAIPNNLEKYEPTTTKDETNVQGDRIMVQKVFEYIFVPSKDTIYTIIPEFSYLSPKTGLYETIKAGPFNINVVKGTGKPISDEGTAAHDDISGLISDDTRVFSISKSPWASTWHLGSLLMIILSTSIGVFVKKRNISRLESDRILKSKAVSIAKKNLQSAANYMDRNDAKAFYEEIALATTGYIVKKYNIPNTESSVDNIVATLTANNASTEVKSKYQDIQKQCELARFAGKYGNLSALYNDAEWMIDELEKSDESF